ncbi:MAG: Uma2 family endonuclease [Plectolyngbya sp. WJT66-NPBG17]|jgi:Uma2 family endonuclease|nr:Uma2 family endonuclease [Plectolyngbya sp. WJT66-NPBG17]
MIAIAPQETLAPSEELPSKPFTLEDFVEQSPQDMEWVDGKLVEKTGMTVQHALAQSKLVTHWNNYSATHEPGGEALTEAPCRTLKQGRRPDIAYLPPSVFAQVRQLKTAPQSYPLIAEVASPKDYAKELFAKAIEYLESGCEEVWLVFPEAKLIMVKTIEQSWQVFSAGQTISTQKVLSGFSIAVDQVFA